MATAMAFPEAKKGGDRKSSCFNQLDRGGFDKAYLSRARYVLRNNPPAKDSAFPQYALDVMDGRMTLTEAYDATPGQKAMATAMAFPEPKRGVHSELKNLTGTAKVYLSQARFVLRLQLLQVGAVPKHGMLINFPLP